MPESTARASSRRASKEAPKTGLSAGDYVTNPLKPDWGPGRVVDLQRAVVFVYFRDRPGKEVIRMKESGLVPAEPDAQLAEIPGFVEKNGGFAIEKTKRAAKGGVKVAAKGGKAKPAVIRFEQPDVDDIVEVELDPEEELLDETEE